MIVWRSVWADFWHPFVDGKARVREKPASAHHGAPRAMWLDPVLVAVLASYAVPFTVLRGVDAWYGSMLLWCCATAVVVVVNAVVSSAWRD